MSDVTYDSASHYDRITDAWTLLLGAELHYGVFAEGTESLSEATGKLTQLMVEAAKIEAGVEVLDVGCGTGAPARHLADRHGARVTGITTSVVGVNSARGAAREAGLQGSLTFEVRDGMDNGFSDDSFDRVWVLESSHLMPRRERLMAECARVLHPGGRLALCDVMLRRPMPFQEVLRLREPLWLLREVFGEARMEPLSHYAEMARAEGLTVEQETDLTDVTRPTFARWRDNATLHRDEVVASIGESDWQRFVDSCDVLERFWDDGTLGYGLLAASKR